MIKMGMDKKIKIVLISLIILVVLLIGYVGILELDKHSSKIAETYYVKGYNQGETDIIVKINSEASIPVRYQEGNQTKIRWVELTNE